MRKQRIAIVGAGTAGLAAATFLARQGHEVTVLERAPSLTPVGAGLLLQPPGLVVLERLGVRAQLEQLGCRVDQLVGTTRQGRRIMSVRYATLDPDLYGLGVHRASLCHVLMQALASETHDLWLDTEVSAIDQQRDAVLIRLRRDGHEASVQFDVALVANGSASHLRPPELVKLDRPYPWGALWTMLPVTADSAVPELRQRYDGSHTMAGLLPTGAIPEQSDGSLQSFFWSLPVTEIRLWQRGEADFARWHGQLCDLWPEARDELAAIAAPEQLIPATYRDVILKRFAHGRIGLLGDAAHAMSPQLGQGATMALLDAQALANAVARALDWGQVWTLYQRDRQAQLRFYQSMSRLLTPVFQSHIPGAGLLRDVGFPVMNAVPWIRKQMARTVAGHFLSSQY